MLASDGQEGNYFGSSLDLDDNILVVGATRGESLMTTNAGAAYVFLQTESGWLEQEKLTAGTFDDSIDHFGYSVSLDDNQIFIGAPLDESNEVNNNEDSGAVHIFEFENNGWQHKDWLFPTDGQGYDLFGYSVDVSKNWAVIGAPGDNNSSGSVYLYQYESEENNWNKLDRIFSVASNPTGEGFGAAMHISTGWLVIGAPYNDEIDVNAGLVYSYLHDLIFKSDFQSK